MNTMNTARRAQVIRCLIEGCSINSAVRMTGAAKHTVLKLLVELGEAFMEFLNETMVNLHCERIQVDEIWRFVGCKQKNVTEKKIERDRICGDVWTWTAIDAESAGFNDKSWLDMVGHPHSERLHVTEKFRRTDFGHMQVDVTYEDPETLTRPLTMSVNADHVPLIKVNFAADADMLEYVCNEDERDTEHLVGTAKATAHPSPAVLDRYAGDYRFRDGVISSRDFFGLDQIISVVKGQLYMKDFPLIPQSDARFDSTAGMDRVSPGFKWPGHRFYSQRCGGRCSIHPYSLTVDLSITRHSVPHAARGLFAFRGTRAQRWQILVGCDSLKGCGRRWPLRFPARRTQPADDQA